MLDPYYYRDGILRVTIYVNDLRINDNPLRPDEMDGDKDLMIKAGLWVPLLFCFSYQFRTQAVTDNAIAPLTVLSFRIMYLLE